MAMKKDCTTCKYNKVPGFALPCDSCFENADGTFTEWAAQSNADRIRNMTDEELAHFLSIAGCPEGQTWSEGCAIPIDCEVCWSGWLKDEVKDV